MGARRIPNATNEKIIALMSMGKTSEQAAFAVGASGSYCNKLYTVVKHIANEQWDELIEYSRSATTGGVIAWACEYLDTQLPQEVAETIEAVRYRSATPPAAEAAICPCTLCRSVCSAVNAVHATAAAHGSTMERSTSFGAVSAASTMARNTAIPHPPWMNNNSSRPSCGRSTA